MHRMLWAGVALAAIFLGAVVQPARATHGGAHLVLEDAEVDARGYYADTLRATITEADGTPVEGLYVAFTEWRGNQQRHLCAAYSDGDGVATCEDLWTWQLWCDYGCDPILSPRQFEVVPTVEDTTIVAWVNAELYGVATGRFRAELHDEDWRDNLVPGG